MITIGSKPGLLLALFWPDWALGATLIGVVALTVGLVYGAILLTRSRPRVGIVTAVLALVAFTGICAGTFGLSLSAWADPKVIGVVLLVGLISIASGIALFVRERRLDGFDPGRSLGLLFAGIGVFAVVSATILPTLPMEFNPPIPTLPVTPSATTTRTPAPTRTPRETPTVTAIPSLTPTPTSIPTLTQTPTYEVPVLPTSVEPTATLTATLVSCTLTVDRNVNLRRGPSAGSERILTIPYQTVLPVIARSADKGWWRVTFQNEMGWVSAEFVTADPNCKLVPTAGAT